MKKIIVLIDFSASSINAIHYAENFAGLLKAKLEIFYVHQIKTEIKYTRKGNPYTKTNPFPPFVEQKMKELIKAHKSNHIKAEYSIVEEDILNEKIFEMQQTKEADLIVVGISNENEVFYKNNLTELIEKNTAPLLIVPENH